VRKVIIDLGTGDGRFIYNNALKNPDDLYIGIDPSEKQMKIYAKKAKRKKLENIQFLVGSVDVLPKELKDSADELYIRFPWGSLLENVVKPTPEFIQKLQSITKVHPYLEIVFGYEKQSEPSEVRRMDLPELDENYIRKNIIPVFEKGLSLPGSLEILDKSKLKALTSTWGKKLAFGQNRPIFRIILTK